MLLLIGIRRSFYGDCMAPSPCSLNVSKLIGTTSFMYAHNVAKITNRRYVTGTIPGADCIHLTKLDIYIGYTEDIIKICARIADLPSLEVDLVDIEVNEM